MRRRRFNFQFNRLFQQGERQLIRLIVLGSVILVIVQFGLAREPVQFYLQMAREIESPYLELNLTEQTVTAPASSQTDSTAQTRLYKITLKATPNSPVRVFQNDQELGILTKGELGLAVQAGIIRLDAGKVKQPIQVQVIKLDPRLSQPQLNRIFYCNGDIQEIWIGN
ncbi:MAG: hypothetical protein PHZ11_04635 [Desulfitobacteriaceae bacterium]|nr:hypothetical protein [Desulfitobacteriaceae bacterium]MDD4346174.1 hypothetical protein [Desulfitobacteriaceae bacterium]MDD4400877.1 hypothetical protein [Desulfitobacteriaceae bacterium]